MPRSQLRKATHRKTTHRKTRKATHRKTAHRKTTHRKSRHRKSRKTIKPSPNSQYKTIEFPNYKDKSELVGTNLKNKVIHGAYMKDMNLSHALLHGTKFVDCTFNNVNFDHAYIDNNTEFINCKFIRCKTDSIKYINGARKEDFDMVFSSTYE
jgi:uncharacterized protein YjbI with pentapeptide repeats